MSRPIIFYDIPSTLPGKAWSPNTWKTRYALNMKGILYETQWVEYPDIEDVAKSIGAPATSTKADGSPLYTLPIISDPNTNRTVADSFLIAEYLDATYPTSGVTLIPKGTAALMRAFESAIRLNAIKPALMLHMATGCAVLNPRSKEYFRRTREVIFGKTMEQFSPPDGRAEEWAKTQEGLGNVNSWLVSGQKYVMGETVSYADAILGAHLIWIKITQGAESEEWKNIASWHEGKWAAVLDTSLDVYTKV